MAADRIITCTNKDGDSITFTERDFTPFILLRAEGVYDSKSNINVMENTMTDGAVYQSSVTPYRNIVLTVKDISKTKSNSFVNNGDIYISSAVIKNKTLEILRAQTPQDAVGGKDFAAHRSLLDKIFKKNETGRLSFIEDSDEKVIDYYVENIDSTGTFDTRVHTISLICPDPFFYNPNEYYAFLVSIIPSFEFIHEFTSNGEQLGYLAVGDADIYNDSANDNIGITITIKGSADIINPKITRLESAEFIQIGDSNNPFTLQVGELLTITTGIGDKHVYLTSNGLTTEINYYLAEGSTFLQLMRGDNHLFYEADSGKTTSTVYISYKMQYARA